MAPTATKMHMAGMFFINSIPKLLSCVAVSRRAICQNYEVQIIFLCRVLAPCVAVCVLDEGHGLQTLEIFYDLGPSGMEITLK